MAEDALRMALEAVEDETTFIAFVEALAQDRLNSAAAWQNDTIDGFLECAHAWAVASKSGTEFYAKPGNPWRRCADILYMGKIYE
jgi:hypothetical protein